MTSGTEFHSSRLNVINGNSLLWVLTSINANFYFPRFWDRDVSEMCREGSPGARSHLGAGGLEALTWCRGGNSSGRSRTRVPAPRGAARGCPRAPCPAGSRTWLRPPARPARNPCQASSADPQLSHGKSFWSARGGKDKSRWRHSLVLCRRTTEPFPTSAFLLGKRREDSGPPWELSLELSLFSRSICGFYKLNWKMLLSDILL